MLGIKYMHSKINLKEMIIRPIKVKIGDLYLRSNKINLGNLVITTTSIPADQVQIKF